MADALKLKGHDIYKRKGKSNQAWKPACFFITLSSRVPLSVPMPLPSKVEKEGVMQKARINLQDPEVNPENGHEH